MGSVVPIIRLTPFRPVHDLIRKFQSCLLDRTLLAFHFTGIFAWMREEGTRRGDAGKREIGKDTAAGFIESQFRFDVSFSIRCKIRNARSGR